MSADSFHARTEREMKSSINVYDFDDFVKCVKSAGVNVIVLSFQDFRNYGAAESKAKLSKPGRPYLSDISVAQFRRGGPVVHYKLGMQPPTKTMSIGVPENRTVFWKNMPVGTGNDLIDNRE